jgi:hypothetical protein
MQSLVGPPILTASIVPMQTWKRAVGMFFRLASSCLRVSTVLLVDFLAMIIRSRSPVAQCDSP